VISLHHLPDFVCIACIIAPICVFVTCLSACFEKEDLEVKTVVKKIREVPSFKTKNMKESHCSNHHFTAMPLTSYNQTTP